ncbi:hypothetical protein M427DRAFT_136544 [Gonapodya prolifera JEL478]|uniref:Uncharacterized protein n=1 Tax=Gonapodya prolifera (strain JEL478) TaxID=1344416 RepID=A0A139A9I7_GONPJ|nr:hypothetical protein M427DRAFT_136544 [Gonapodya prolifera JEL478]|eukprot:KXS13344.1 hypothetical protein M427DRAFT_136544 [Gonapodya prolifera JEL478]
MTQRVRTVVATSKLSETSQLRLSLPPPSKTGISEVFSGDVGQTSTLAQLLETIRERYPVILSQFHAFHYAGNDWKRWPDLELNSTVKAAVDGWLAFSFNEFASKQQPPIEPNEPLELRIVVKEQRVAEIERNVIGLEREYWANIQAMKYLKSLPARSSEDNELLAKHISGLGDCLGSLKQMRDQWAEYVPASNDGNTSSVGRLSVPLSTWLLSMRNRLSDRNRVPSDINTNFLPHLYRLLATPPPGFTMLWETEMQKVEPLSTATYVSPDEETLAELVEYRCRKTEELDQITDDEIQSEVARQRASSDPPCTALVENPPVSPSFLSSALVQHAVSQQYPNLTYSAKSKTLERAWSLLEDTARRLWWRRDAWLEKGKAASRRDMPSMFAWTSSGNSAESRTEQTVGVTANSIPASEFKSGEPTSTEDKPKPIEPSVTAGVPLGPFSFTVTSDTVLWGQLPLIAYAGVMSPTASLPTASSTDDATPGTIPATLDGPTSLPKRLTGGTILQHQFRYRSPARRGTWLVTPFHANVVDSDRVGESREDDGMFVGWVVHHENVDPGEVVVRASRVGPSGGGISNGNGHTDKSVLYINRYDWSYHGTALNDPSFPPRFCAKFADVTDEAELREILDLAKKYANGNLCVVDGGDLKLDTVECGIIANIQNSGFNNTTKTTEWTFTEAGRGAFGCQVKFKDTEYELAWQIYEPSPTSPSQREMVAMVYDATYHALNGDRFWVKKGGVGVWEIYPKGEVVCEDIPV